MRVKYISYKGALCNTMVIFPEVDQHGDIANKMGLLKSDIIGAGFISLTTYECYGKSHSLGISSNPTDSDLAYRLFVGD